mgnify:CR=1 FL=1
MGFSADWGKERATAWGQRANAVARSLPQILSPSSLSQSPVLFLARARQSPAQVPTRAQLGPNSD